MKSLVIGAMLLPLLAVPAFADGDPAAGEAVFKKCMACHAVGADAKNKIGPELNGVFGQPAAGRDDGYAYSAGLKEAGAGGLIWTPETLAKWLHKPKDVVPNTKMTFAGLTDDADVANVIAYLATFSPDYKPAQ
jgi:cytochrome c